MKDVIVYFIQSYLRKANNYSAFYLGLYKDVWHIPTRYDLDDTTLFIRLIKFTAATAVLFTVIIYITNAITKHWYASAASGITPIKFALNAYFFVYGLALVLYFANKLYPRRSLSYRSAACLMHISFLLLLPVSLFLMMIFPVSSNDPQQFTSAGATNAFWLIHTILVLSVCVVIFRHEMLLLKMRFWQTVRFQISVLFVELILILISISLMFAIQYLWQFVPKSIENEFSSLLKHFLVLAASL